MINIQYQVYYRGKGYSFYARGDNDYWVIDGIWRDRNASLARNKGIAKIERCIYNADGTQGVESWTI